MEVVSVAAYKKTPKDLAPIWRSWMRAVSCWSRAWSAPGRLGARRPICAVPATGPRSRPSPPSASPRVGDARPCTPGSIGARTSARPRSSSSFSNCSAISAGPWSSSGTTAGSTGARSCDSSCRRTRASTRIASRGMHPNSTRMSSSGTISSAPWPTVSPATSEISSSCFIPRSSGSVSPRSCSGRASMRQISRGSELSITYA